MSGTCYESQKQLPDPDVITIDSTPTNRSNRDTGNLHSIQHLLPICCIRIAISQQDMFEFFKWPTHITCSVISWNNTVASFQLFLGGSNFFNFSNATGQLKIWKKQHFICSNLTLFIVPFFLFSLFFFFFSFFSLFFFFFFLFFFVLFPWGGGRWPPAPSNDAPGTIRHFSWTLGILKFQILGSSWRLFHCCVWSIANMCNHHFIS